MTSTAAPRFLAAACAVAGLALAGCAGFGMLDNDVASFGDWPAAKAPGTYGFERLPSQQADAPRQDALEKAAVPALERAGFKAAAQGAAPDVIVQIGARVDRTDRSPWDDPMWWRGPGRIYPVYWNGPWFGSIWHPWPAMDTTRYQREVAILLRDRESGKPLYEAHASNTGITQGGVETVAAMFDATLAEFPKSDGKVHTVRTQTAPQ